MGHEERPIPNDQRTGSGLPVPEIMLPGGDSMAVEISAENFPTLPTPTGQRGIPVCYRYETRALNSTMLPEFLAVPPDRYSLVETALRQTGLVFPGRTIGWANPSDFSRQVYNSERKRMVTIPNYRVRREAVHADPSYEDIDYEHPGFGATQTADRPENILTALRLALGIDDVQTTEELDALLQTQYAEHQQNVKNIIISIARQHAGSHAPKAEAIILPNRLKLDHSLLLSNLTRLVKTYNIQHLVDAGIVPEESLGDLYAGAAYWMKEAALRVSLDRRQKREMGSFFPYALGIDATEYPPLEAIPYIEESFLAFMLELPGVIPDGFMFPLVEVETSLQALGRLRDNVVKRYVKDGGDPAIAQAVSDYCVSVVEPDLIQAVQYWRADTSLWNHTAPPKELPESDIPTFAQFAEAIHKAGGRGPRRMRIQLRHKGPNAFNG